MHTIRILSLAVLLLPVLLAPSVVAQQTATAPLPAIPQLMREVDDHQKELDKLRENYTYSSLITIRTWTQAAR